MAHARRVRVREGENNALMYYSEITFTLSESIYICMIYISPVGIQINRVCVRHREWEGGERVCVHIEKEKGRERVPLWSKAVITLAGALPHKY